MQACTTCGARLVAGSLFCDSCGATASTPQVVRKLRQSSFSKIKDATDGLLAPGERIKGRQTYLIEEAIAKSGFGATFRAQRLSDEKQVLIKQMLEQSSYDQFRKQLLQSFKREANFLRKIRHPAFPRGFEYFERNKSFYLVMEFINGKELAKAVSDYREKNSKVEDGLVVHLGVEIAEALEIIHLQGYVYRDLKPQNVMLDGISSRVKLIDFGTLYHRSDVNPLIFESEGYTPPDLLQKDVTYTAAGDIYSLGALLYEMVVGTTPELGKLADLDKTKCDERLRTIIKKCLEIDPAKRYQSARTVRDELTKLTKKGFWPFRNPNAIERVELSVLPKTLYPSASTFCEFCGYADPQSQAGYCPKCRVALRVGRISLVAKKGERAREFFLYSDETIIGASNQAHFAIKSDKGALAPKHIRVFRRATQMWIESIERDKANMVIGQRKILGPVELIDGDTIKIDDVAIVFTLKDAC